MKTMHPSSNFNSNYHNPYQQQQHQQYQQPQQPQQYSSYQHQQGYQPAYQQQHNEPYPQHQQQSRRPYAPPESEPQRQTYDRGSLIGEPSKTLFVGDLSFFCTEKHLYELFHVYGGISSIQIRRGMKGESLQYGFVVFDSCENAHTALVSVDNKEFMGRCIK
jgi:hypothetical protein